MRIKERERRKKERERRKKERERERRKKERERERRKKERERRKKERREEGGREWRKRDLHGDREVCLCLRRKENINCFLLEGLVA